MAQLRESTTIGGSIAITAKNIHEYLDNVVIEGVGGGLELNKHTFEEYVKIHNITDLDQLSTANDSGLYLTTGGITNPPVALYGSITLPPILTGAYWKPKMFEVDTSYFLTKSPMSDASIILIFNRSNKPTTKDMIILCYHLKTNVWYQMEQNSSTGKFSKKWEVKKEIEREFRAFDKVDGALKALSNNLAQTDKNVGVHGTRLTKVEALAVENKNETVAIRKDVVPKSDVVQTIGTSTSRVMSQKAIRDYTDSVGDTTGKFMREGAFGIGGDIRSEGFDADDVSQIPRGLSIQYSVQGENLPTEGNGYIESNMYTGTGATKNWGYQNFYEISTGRIFNRTRNSGRWLKWDEILSTANTTTDKNNVLYSGTKKPLDSLNTSNIVTTTGTSTVNAMSQKTVTDELNKKWDTQKTVGGGDILRESAYGVGSISAPRISSDLNTRLKAGFYTVTSSATNAPIGFDSGDSFIEWGWDSNNYSQIFITQDSKLHTRKKSFGKFGEWESMATNTELDTKITGGTIVQTTGTSTTNVPSQKVFTDEINKKLTAGVLTNVEGTSTTNVMSQKGVTDGLNKRITGGSVQQVVGTSTVNVMSQKATTDELNKRITGGSVQQGVGTSTVNVMSQSATTASLNRKWDIVTSTGYAPNKNIDDYVAGEGGYSRKSNGAPLDGLDIVTKSQYGTPDLLQIGFPQRENKNLMMRTKGSAQGGWGEWFEFYHNANTTIDKSGFLRASGSATALTTSDVTSSLGTSTSLVASQKIVNDVSTRVTTAQSRADNAWTLGNNALAKAQNLKDLANVTTARTNLGLGNSAIRNLTTAQGTSATLVATQKLVNDVKTGLNTEIGKKITGGSVVQSTGTSTTNVMSQKAVTDAVNVGVGMGLGYNQKWVDVTKERSSETDYVNDTGKPIQVIIVGPWNWDVKKLEPIVDGVSLGMMAVHADRSYVSGYVSFIVPNNSKYSVISLGGIKSWVELR